ncbi:MAG: electron transfer flavoprotein subunit alpha/FixB family protein [Verrucomicrobiota bacterium]
MSNKKNKRGNVWVFVEQDEGVIADVSLELVCKARELADELGSQVEAMLLGSNVRGLCTDLHQYGCDNVFLADHEALATFAVLPYARTIVELARAHRPNIILFGATHVGRSLAPRIASELMVGLTADCTDLQIDDFEDKASKTVLKDRLMQIRPAFGGNIIATIVNSWEDPQMVTVREGVMKQTPPDPNRQGEITEAEVPVSEADSIIKIIERAKAERGVDLKGAQIIVAGGYGVGSAENFAAIREFARTIGGEVGASRAAVDAGWVDHDHQVGQTGVTVRPRLYIACGISGSVQHRAGMSDSGTVIAINSDADAPIFAVAHYGIVGDLNKVIPAFIEAYKAADI